MLKKSGKIAQDATLEQAEEVLNKYLGESAQSSLKQQNTADFEKKQIAELKEKLVTTGLVNGNGKKVGNVSMTAVQQQPYGGAVRKDKVLVLLINFPDYPHNSVTREEIDMYYDDYSTQHFQDMVFGDNGYTGQNGEKRMSMKQYYEEQSGGSYTVDGKIAKWYTAKTRQQLTTRI